MTPPDEVLTQAAPPAPATGERTLAGHEQIVLDRPGATLAVARGQVGVYLVRLEGGRPIGRREHLMTRTAGEWIVGGCAVVEGRTVGLLVAPLGPCSVVHGSLEGAAAAEGTIEALEDWCLAMCQLLGEGTAPSYAEFAQESDRLTVPAGTAFRARGSEVSIIELEAGQARLLGAEYLGIDPDGGPVALSARAWLTAAGSADVVVRFAGVRRRTRRDGSRHGEHDAAVRAAPMAPLPRGRSRRGPALAAGGAA